MRYIDLFAGMGGFRTAFDRQGFECVFSSEIDKYAANAYEILYGNKPSGDITKIDEKEIPDHDILCGGFPCQAFSVAGKQKGFQDTRGTLFFDIARIAKEKQPRLLVLENVKGLLSHEKGETFFTILKTLDEVGYDAEWRVLNSKNFGVPQNRERVFIVGHLRGKPRREIFPIGRESSNTCHQVGTIEGIRGDDSVKRVYNVQGISPTLTTMQGGHRQPKIVQPVLTPFREEKRRNGRRFKSPDEPAFTVNTIDRHGVKVGTRIRKLTPLECFRLQGFPDEYYHKLRNAGFSDSQLYKLAGNAVSVPPVEEIASKIRRFYVENSRD